jgi:UDP-N-acetyl-D-glucosamine dehydrogenase
MPYFCLDKITRALNSVEKSVKGSTVHFVGVSYKADVSDLRESPALKLVELLRDEGADVSYHDPHVPAAPSSDADLRPCSGSDATGENGSLNGRVWKL